MLAEFEAGYEKEDKEIVVLLKDHCNGASVFEKKWLIPSVNFIASIDETTGEIIKEEGRIEWIIENDPSRKGWGHAIEISVEPDGTVSDANIAG